MTVMLFTQTAFAVCVKANDTTEPEIHVSPYGSDANKGTPDSPIATMEKARKLVRDIKSQKNVPVTVVFHEGTYRLSRTINFDEQDSGTENAPITYKAADGERVIFKGSKVLDTSKFNKVTDPAVLERLPEGSRNLVGVLNLREQGINTVLPVSIGRAGMKAMYGYHQLYFNDNPQTLARFPNNYFTKPEAITNANTKTFRVRESNITRWGQAKDARAGGYFLNDYRYEREEITNIDPVERTLSISDAGYKISGSERRYFVYNLLEEIDMPGEWYIDPETYLLYYYPQNGISNETLEISTLGSEMIKMSDVHFVNFEGLEFAQTCYDAFQLPSCTDISFDKCYFHDIENCAIRDFSDYYRANQKTPNTYRISVKDSVFRNIGAQSVNLMCGDETTLTEGECIIDNCYFTEGGTEIRSYVPFVSLSGVGITVKNCTMHNTAVHMIQGAGSLHKIINNEFYDACKETHDVGVIYMGRNHYQRGVEVANNYFHHAKCLDDSIGIIACGVYMDDTLCEWYIHHNIFEGVPRGVFNHAGSDHRINDNIFVNCDLGVRYSAGTYSSWGYVMEDAKAMMEKYPVYLEKFPSMKYMYAPLNPENKSHNNVTRDNLFVNSGNDTKYDLGELPMHNVSENNAELDSFNDFVDPDNGIYDIKEGSDILNDLPGLKDIKTEEMGCSKDMLERAEALVNNDIIKTMPRNGAESVNAAKVEFSWTKSGVYDKYRIRIATDSKMENVVIDEVVPYNYYSTTELNANSTTYYWNVEGVDVSQYKHENKQSYGAAYKFKTSKYENTDKILLNNALNEAKEFIVSVTEGDKGGQCAPGAKAEFQKVIDKGDEMMASKYSSQAEVDAMTKELSDAKKKLVASRKVMYLPIDEYLSNPTGWDYSGNTTTFNNGIMHLQDSEYGMYMGKNLEGYQLLKFKMKADFENDWTGIGLREQASGLTYAVGGCGYMLIIKRDNIEFQRYNNGGGLLKTIPNNCIKPNQWHEIEVGALDEENGIRVILRVDGQTILNELDTDGVITKDGYFKVFNRMSNGQRTDVSVELAPSDEEIGEVDQSVITGRLTAVTPEIKDAYTTLFEDDTALKTYNASYERTGDGIKFISDKDAQYGGTLASYGKTVGNEVFNASIKFNISDGWQGIGLRADDYEGIPWNLNNYMFIVKKDTVELQRFSQTGGTYLAIEKNEYIKDGVFTDLTFGAYPTDEGMRIIIYAGDNKVIDYTDPYSKHQSICVNFYDRFGNGMEIKPTK